jgi:hypothetical protein
MDKPSTPQTEQIPHSGNLPDGLRENPINEYDKTSLQEAYDNDLLTSVVTPDTPADLIEEKAEKNKSTRRLFTKIGVVASIAISATGATIFGVNSMASNEPLKSDPVPAASAEPLATNKPEVVPESNGFEVVGLPSVSELEISAEQSDEEIAQDIVSIVSDWGMSGANSEMNDLQYEGDNSYLSLPEYVNKISEASDPVYAEVLYGENATNPVFQESIELQENRHNQILTAHFQTYGNQNSAPYFSKQNFESLVSATENTDGTKTLVVDMVREDNGDENIVDGSGNGYETEATFVTAAVDGKIKLVQPATFIAQ